MNESLSSTDQVAFEECMQIQLTKLFPKNIHKQGLFAKKIQAVIADGSYLAPQQNTILSPNRVNETKTPEDTFVLALFAVLSQDSNIQENVLHNWPIQEGWKVRRYTSLLGRNESVRFILSGDLYDPMLRIQHIRHVRSRRKGREVISEVAFIDDTGEQWGGHFTAIEPRDDSVNELLRKQRHVLEFVGAPAAYKSN